MLRNELIKELKKLSKRGDTEIAHSEADNLLIQYINDDEIEKAYEAVPKWYA